MRIVLIFWEREAEGMRKVGHMQTWFSSFCHPVVSESLTSNWPKDRKDTIPFISNVPVISLGKVPNLTSYTTLEPTVSS